MSLTNAQVKARIAAASKDLANLLANLPPDLPPPPPSSITTPGQLDAALAKAIAGDVLHLDPTLVYPAPLVLTVGVALTSSALLPGRMTLGTPAPRLIGGVTLASPAASLHGVEVKHGSPDAEIVIVQAPGCTLDRVRVLGDPVNGAHRGINANAGSLAVSGCYVDDIFRPGQDTQALCCWDSPGKIAIDDCFFRAASETVLLGGADSSSAAHVPSDIAITNCTLSKKLAWRTLSVNVKNGLEIKSAKRVTVLNCLIENAWAAAQTGFLIVLTPRNQDGTAPWSTVEDVEIAHNTLTGGCAAFQILGIDDAQISQRMARVSIHDNTVTDLDPVAWGSIDGPDAMSGDNRMILILNGPDALSIVNNTFAANGLGSVIYFDGPAKCTGLKVTGNRFPQSSYGIFGTEGQSVCPGVNQPHPLFTHFAPDGVLTGNTEA
jgi:hypothetical protein